MPRRKVTQGEKLRKKVEKLAKLNAGRLSQYVVSPKIKYCKKCGLQLNSENAKLILRKNNRAGGYMLDVYCYSCRCAKQKTFNARRPIVAHQPKTWQSRMLENPVYFADIFHKPATPENIAAEAQKLGM